jgi:malonate decarboxylase delta subunit
METLHFTFDGGQALASGATPALVGVVGSGNLEVLVEPTGEADCHIEVTTAATGFGRIWQAVLDDFFARHRPAGIRLSIHDVGATPAIVALRLDQAIDAFRGKKR